MRRFLKKNVCSVPPRYIVNEAKKAHAKPFIRGALFALVLVWTFSVVVPASATTKSQSTRQASGSTVTYASSHVSSNVSTELLTSIFTDVDGNDSIDAYIGTGGLLLPDSYTGSRSQKHKVASCIDCVWRYTIYCMWTQSDVSCQHAVMSCPKGKLRYRVWFGRSAGTLAQIGSVCIGKSSPVTRKSVERMIKQRLLKYVPKLAFRLQPSQKSLVTIPMIGYVTSASTYKPKSFDLSGYDVQIRAKAKYRWDWGDGSTRWYASRGGPYPNKTISHTYRISKKFVVRVSTEWSANYTISGIGEFAVGGEAVHQTLTKQVAILEAHSRLVRNHLKE